MAYTVGGIAAVLGIPASTIRFYDRKGLLPFVERTPGGIRQFDDQALERMRNILLLRRFGLSIREIEAYVRLEERGEETAPRRLAMLEARRKTLEREVRALEETLSLLERACRDFPSG